jgi:SAM-dependent methyltransferase
MAGSDPYYHHDLALVHHRGFGFHAVACAPGILELLAPVRARGGLVVEIGCGSGLLTAELLAAGHRVVATDASPAMLELAAGLVGEGCEELRRVALPEDPLPRADAIVGVGHALNYLPDAGSVDRAWCSMAEALEPGGVLAVDVCDLEWGVARRGLANLGRCGTDWAIITEFSMPAPDRFVRDMTTFVPQGDGSWRRDSEHHENVLVDTSAIPALLASRGVRAQVAKAFGTESLPPGLRAVVGVRTGDAGTAPDGAG